jgi:hypothetical protein
VSITKILNSTSLSTEDRTLSDILRIMRYYFILISICIVWIVGISIAHFSLKTSDRFWLYISMMTYTLGAYIIGFTSKKT